MLNKVNFLFSLKNLYLNPSTQILTEVIYMIFLNQDTSKVYTLFLEVWGQEKVIGGSAIYFLLNHIEVFNG
jgi:hypothetical protein